MASELAIALGLVLVIEGILPFAWPSGWRAAARKASETAEPSLRIMGLSMMLIGTVIVSIAR